MIMKKVIFIILAVLLLTGCNNSVDLKFDDKINTTINLNFSLDDYRNHSSESKYFSDDELKSQIEAIKNDNEAFSTGNNEPYNEIKYEENGNNYSATYDYNYTYDNFKYNMVLNSCFEYFLVDEDEDTIYISLSGNSICSPATLNVTAPSRMISNNAHSIKGNKYTWNISSNNNDIYMAISKTELNGSSKLIYLLYFSIIIIFIVGAYFIKKKKLK